MRSVMYIVALPFEFDDNLTGLYNKARSGTCNEPALEKLQEAVEEQIVLSHPRPGVDKVGLAYTLDDGKGSAPVLWWLYKERGSASIVTRPTGIK